VALLSGRIFRIRYPSAHHLQRCERFACKHFLNPFQKSLHLDTKQIGSNDKRCLLDATFHKRKACIQLFGFPSSNHSVVLEENSRDASTRYEQDQSK
jgi:hypothetical protein